MQTLNSIFKEDFKVNKEPYFKSIAKMIVLFILFIFAFTLSSLVIKNILFVVASVIVLIIAICITLRSSIKLLNFKLFSIKELMYTTGGCLVLFSINLIYMNFVSQQNLNTQIVQAMYKDIPFWGLLISIAIIPSFVEEIIARGFILRIIFRNHLFIGMLVSTVFFVFLHNGNDIIGFLPYIYSGIILSLIYLKTRRLEITIAIHFLNNFISIFYLF